MDRPRIRPPLVFFCSFFERNYKDWINCKLPKSRTKWTGLLAKIMAYEDQKHLLCHQFIKLHKCNNFDLKQQRQLMIEWVKTVFGHDKVHPGKDDHQFVKLNNYMATYVGPQGSPGLVGLPQPSPSLGLTQAPADQRARARLPAGPAGKKGYLTDL